MQHDVDLAILGGGCAGLSLATRLIGSGLSVAVIEPRETYTADRAWSYWAFQPHPFGDCVVKRWDHWRVSSGDREIIRGGQDFRYETVDGAAFYEACQRRLTTTNNITLHLGTRAAIAQATASGVHLDLEGRSAGVMSARHVIDTRPLSGQPKYGQWFVGHEIETQEDCFTPDVCDLMAFGPSHDAGIDFTYILPFSSRRALVEATVFADTAPDAPTLERALDQAIRKTTGGSAHQVMRSEAGMVPMDATFADPAQLPNVIPFGVRGGAARPSTGYAFARIQARADEIAEGLNQGRAPVHPKCDGQITRAMDRLFLNVIRRRPDIGPALFMQLFENAGGARLERFLSGSTEWRDRLAIMAALPTGLFLSHLVRP
jgi:lycopene beta-cyclase